MILSTKKNTTIICVQVMTQNIVSEAWFSPGTFYSLVSIVTQLLHTYTMTTVGAA
jgi:uncharacterized membrane protein